MDSISRITSPLLNGLVFTLALAACSSDKTTNGGTGGAAGIGGGVAGAATGGAAGAATGGVASGMGGSGTGGAPIGAGGATGGAAGGGMGGTAGAAGGMGGMGGDYYFCENRMPTDPGGMGKSGDTCCGGVGKCTDKSTLMGDAVASYGHDTCDKTLVCAPPAPTAAPMTCTTHVGTSLTDGLEGRCVPKCFLLGNPQAPLLDDGGGTCPAMQVCAPCYSPVDAKATGACTTGMDKPTKPAPAKYVECPKGNDAGQEMGGGLCVPENVVNKLSDKMNPLYNPAIPDLKQDNCAMGEKCVPAKKAADPGYCSQQCETNMTLQGLSAALKNGACTPEYVIFDTNGITGVNLTKGMGGAPPVPPCSTPGELCAPCSNPTRNGIPSGACF